MAVSAAVTHRRAAKAEIRAARKLSEHLTRARVRFEVVTRLPGHPEARTRAASTTYLRRVLAAVSLQVAESAARSEPQTDGATITVTARVPRRTPARGTTWDALHLCQLAYSNGVWWLSENGQTFVPVPLPYAPVAEVPHAGA